MLLTPGDDALGKGGAYPRETCEIDHIGPVHIDLLARGERSGQLRGPPGSLLKGGSGRTVAEGQPDVTGALEGDGLRTNRTVAPARASPARSNAARLSSTS